VPQTYISGAVNLNLALTVIPSMVSGNLVLPAPAPGRTWKVVVDWDADSSNGYFKAETGICGDSELVPYAVQGIPAGSYCIYVGIDVDGSGGTPNPGDFAGAANNKQPVLISGSLVQDIPLHVVNHPPTADLTISGQLITGSVLQLAANANDADNDPLTYTWMINSCPDGSAAVLSDSAVASPTFGPVKGGTYILWVSVDDGKDPRLFAVTVTVVATGSIDIEAH
jgi:hypothetical protein